jgi:Protein of unknown function (DUF3108)
MHAFEANPAVRAVPAPDPRRRWKLIAVLSLAALLLHGAVLGGLDWAWPSRETMQPPAGPMQVRVVESPAARSAPVPAVAELPALPMEPVATVAAVASPRVKPVVLREKAPAIHAAALPATPPPPSRADAPPAPIEVALAAPIVRAAAGPASAAASAVPDDEAIPHYRTRVPPAMTLRYEMQRGMLRGTGDLSWRPQGDRYELKLDARVGGVPVLMQVSAGGFDGAGLAPLRFTDQRLRRGTTAANFQREAGKITFSGPATEFALREGAQDRLSWMIQLAAIVAAEPRLGEAGAKVAMVVVGSHGDAGVWVFRCAGSEPVSTGAGTVDAIKFIREPREVYDTTVQVWLDPAQHGMPCTRCRSRAATTKGSSCVCAR